MRVTAIRAFTPVWNFRLGAVAALLLGLGALAACQQNVVNHEDNLAAAGFVVRPANTPERQAMLAHLPPHKFVQRANGDNVHFVYADPTVCKCLYVGSQQAYSQYQRDRQQRNIADEQEMSVDQFSDPAWNWGTWGPWGPEYGYGQGMGW